MRKLLTMIFVVFAAGVSTTSLFAADEVAFAKQIKARQSFMQVYSFNLGQLGAMAKGDAPYDAQLASNAANNLLANARMKNSAMWPAGSHVEASGLAEVTRAKPGIWADDSEIGDKHKALIAALTEMAATADDGLGAVRSNMKAVADGCKGCHQNFRVRRD